MKKQLLYKIPTSIITATILTLLIKSTVIFYIACAIAGLLIGIIFSKIFKS